MKFTRRFFLCSSCERISRISEQTIAELQKQIESGEYAHMTDAIATVEVCLECLMGSKHDAEHPVAQELALNKLLNLELSDTDRSVLCTAMCERYGEHSCDTSTVLFVIARTAVVALDRMIKDAPNTLPLTLQRARLLKTRICSAVIYWSCSDTSSDSERSERIERAAEKVVAHGASARSLVGGVMATDLDALRDALARESAS